MSICLKPDYSRDVLAAPAIIHEVALSQVFYSLNLHFEHRNHLTV